MSQFLKKIVRPQLDFEGVDASDKFIKIFCDLYRIELFKDGLDLILTKLQERDLKLEVRFLKGWDTNLGCYLVEHSSVFDKVRGVFSKSVKKKIILHELSYNVLAHEMAHALAFESGINLGEEFRQCIALDMNGREPQSITLKAEIKRLMVEALKTYPQQQFLSELFARYFELLSISRNVQAAGDFTTSDVMEFFANTTKFIEQIFNPQILSKIDQNIASVTSQIASEVRLADNRQKFQEKVESFHKKAPNSWSKNVKSNASWQVGWQQYQELEDKKNNN